MPFFLCNFAPAIRKGIDLYACHQGKVNEK
jgi:hypothetical protein